MFEHIDEQQIILDTVTRLAKEELEPRAALLDESGEFPAYLPKLYADNGLLNPLLPADFGGAGVSLLTFVIILEEISKVCASSALLLIAQADGMLPILHSGAEILKKKYLTRLGHGSPAVMALAATEPGAGSDLLAMRTIAKRRGDVYVINGCKCFITNGAVADFMTLYAYTDPEKKARGISAFVVEKGTPGLGYGKNENKMGMRGSANSEIYLEDVEIPAENLIGEEGRAFGPLMEALARSRLFCAAQAVGLAQGALDQVTAYARQHFQSGKLMADIPSIQFMVADMAAAVEAGRLMTCHSARLFDSGREKDAQLSAALAKFTATDAAMKVTTDAVQIMEGCGFSKEYPVERMMRDAKLTQIYTGTNQIMRLVAGREVLKG